MPELLKDLPMSATKLIRLLRETQHKIVFAESCTAGLIAATLGKTPGVSEFLAGSAVVYQLETKSAWLNVLPETLDRFGAVSQPVSEQMAHGVLQITPHATIAASVTGHLGPDAPAELDGVAWSTVAIREGETIRCKSQQLTLDPQDSLTDGKALRLARQVTTTDLVIQFCIEQLGELQQ